MMSNSIGCLYLLAGIGVILLTIKLFGEGSFSATIAGIAVFVVTVIAIIASSKK